MDPYETVRMTVDYLFGKDVGLMLPRQNIAFSFSKKTGKIRTVDIQGKLFGTLRADGGIALTVFGAQILTRHPNFKNTVTVMEDIAEFIAQGRSVFAKHVIDCGDTIRPGSEVAVLTPRGDVIAVGRAILSAKMMRQFRSGVAVKVRWGTQKGLSEHQDNSP